MYHPLEEGVFRQETHFPKVQVYRKEGLVRITLCVATHCIAKLREFLQNEWIYVPQVSTFGHEWTEYQFHIRRGSDAANLMEIRALNDMLGACCFLEEDCLTSLPEQAQLCFIHAVNPPLDNEWRLGQAGLSARFAMPVTRTFQEKSWQEYITSHMRGVYKILYNQRSSLALRSSEMRIYGQFPVFRTTGNCACFGVEGSRLDEEGGFTLGSHNIDRQFQQFVILAGTLMLWAKTRKHICATAR